MYCTYSKSHGNYVYKLEYLFLDYISVYLGSALLEVNSLLFWIMCFFHHVLCCDPLQQGGVLSLIECTLIEEPDASDEECECLFIFTSPTTISPSTVRSSTMVNYTHARTHARAPAITDTRESSLSPRRLINCQIWVKTPEPQCQAFLFEMSSGTWGALIS